MPTETPPLIHYDLGEDSGPHLDYGYGDEPPVIVACGAAPKHLRSAGYLNQLTCPKCVAIARIRGDIAADDAGISLSPIRLEVQVKTIAGWHNIASVGSEDEARRLFSSQGARSLELQILKTVSFSEALK